MARVSAAVGELEPAGMSQHVGMNGKCEFRGYARPGHHPLISGCGKRCATFRDEDLRRRWGFAESWMIPVPVLLSVPPLRAGRRVGVDFGSRRPDGCRHPSGGACGPWHLLSRQPWLQSRACAARLRDACPLPSRTMKHCCCSPVAMAARVSEVTALEVGIDALGARGDIQRHCGVSIDTIDG